MRLVTSARSVVMRAVVEPGGIGATFSSLDADAIAQMEHGLSSIGLSYSEIEQVMRMLPPDTLGLMAYGSRSRGDYLKSSDIDLLALVSHPCRAAKAKKVQLSCYTEQQLSSASGTLFGYHLSRDGVILFDTDELLSRTLKTFTSPDLIRLTDRIRALSAILEVSARDRHRYIAGLCRLGRYLLRTAIYLHALADGRPCFSIRELAQRYADPRLATLLASDPHLVPTPSIEGLDELRSRLAELVGMPTQVKYDSLEAIAVAAAGIDPMTSQLARLAMSPNDETLDYSQLAKILL